MSGILERYRTFFSFQEDFSIISLEEGDTPLLRAPQLSQALPVPDIALHLKIEGANPTGSFKDRGMTYAVSQARFEGASHIICASTGNTSASAAAYGTRANLKTIILIPKGKVALGKLSQAIMYGASIIEIEGNFDQALTLVRQLGETGQVTVVNSINPYRIEGQKTAAFEICDMLGTPLDYLFIPVGNAGNITAYWKGFKEYADRSLIQKLPKMFGYEAEGAAAIVKDQMIENPETLATAIRIGNPASWQGAVQARDESDGHIGFVTDAEIISAYQQLAQLEGIFCEPASAASVAGLFKACHEGRITPGSTITCVLTGNGLKDPDTAIHFSATQTTTLPAKIEAIQSFLNL